MAKTPSQYATAAQYRASVDMTTTSQDDEIDDDLEAISRYLDNRLGRFFSKDDEDATRIYTPRVDTDKLIIDDLETLTSIKIDEDHDGSFADEDALASDDYQLLPLNADQNPEQAPFTMIRLTPWGDHGMFTGNTDVQVVGRFGWPAVPKPIERATIQLAAILRLETPRATRRIAELGDSIEASEDAQRLIARLTERYARNIYV